MEQTERMPEPEVQDDPVMVATSRSAVYLIVVAVVFFIVGYGIAWLSFSAATSTQAAAFEEVVQSAVAEAISGLDLQAVAEQPAPPTEEPPPAFIEAVSIDDDPILGPEDAIITIVEFSDFRCPYCARFHAQTLNPLMEQYDGLVRVVYRDFPVVGGERAAEAAQCVYEQGNELFWPYHDLLFENQQALNSDASLIDLAGQVDGVDVDSLQTCLTAGTYTEEIQGDFADGVEYGVRGTPAFFINGHRIIGAQPITAFQQVIDDLLVELDANS